MLIIWDLEALPIIRILNSHRMGVTRLTLMLTIKVRLIFIRVIPMAGHHSKWASRIRLVRTVKEGKYQDCHISIQEGIQQIMMVYLKSALATTNTHTKRAMQAPTFILKATLNKPWRRSNIRMLVIHMAGRCNHKFIRATRI